MKNWLTNQKSEFIGLRWNQGHLQVEFTDNYPEGKVGGTFDFPFKDGKNEFVLADLIS